MIFEMQDNKSRRNIFMAMNVGSLLSGTGK